MSKLIRIFFKRCVDIIVSLFGLVLLSPVLIIVMVLIWINDYNHPLYIAERIGQNQKPFKMIKFRTMIKNANLSGVESTSADDVRITRIGKFLREYKLDEIPQLLNVFSGRMSLVGPRPNVKKEVELYSNVENRILTAKPGITDLASIVFFDEGEILKGSKDPDLEYNQKIRPWKSQLALFYVDKRFEINYLDLRILYLTLLSLFNRSAALSGVESLLVAHLAENEELTKIASRKISPYPAPPPGLGEIVKYRNRES